MNTILQIGSCRFRMPSAAIAAAVCEALVQADAVEPVLQDGNHVWRPVGPHARPHVSVFASGWTLAIDPAPQQPSPLVEALLGEPPRSRRRTWASLLQAASAGGAR